MKGRKAVILAAGKGTRMKSDLYKVMHPLCGLPMVEHVMRAVEASGTQEIVTIVGHGAQAVESLLGDRSLYALQEEQLGTGHAVMQAKELLAGQTGSTLVICGDTPLFTAQTLTALYDFHESQGAAATILTAHADQPQGYGRIIRDEAGEVAYIVEEKDANDQERLVQEVNTGTYVFSNDLLFQALDQTNNDNAQGEYYLPDVIEILKKQGHKVEGYMMADAQEGMGVNDRVALAQASTYLQARINEDHMREGVTFVNPQTTYIEPDVTIGPDTVLEGGVSLKGQTRIGTKVFIGANSEIVDSLVGDHVEIRQSVIESSQVDQHTKIGPYAHLRPDTKLGQHVKIGNFVEVKNSTIGDHTHASHLTYVGDSDLGQRVNLGCGTVFVNYDGKNKHRSTVGDDVFVGCNVNLVAPVTIGDRAFLAAGSTITKDVPAEALGIARERQVNIPDYQQRRQVREKE